MTTLNHKETCICPNCHEHEAIINDEIIEKEMEIRRKTNGGKKIIIRIRKITCPSCGDMEVIDKLT